MGNCQGAPQAFAENYEGDEIREAAIAMFHPFLSKVNSEYQDNMLPECDQSKVISSGEADSIVKISLISYNNYNYGNTNDYFECIRIYISLDKGEGWCSE